MRYQGRITRWQDDRGFGYITPNGGGNELFVHVRALSGWRGRPAGGEIVTYGHARDARGRACAADVRRVDLRPVRGAPRSPSPGTGVWWGIGGFLAALVAAVAFGRLPLVALAACVAMSALTFGVYALDKAAAQQGRWRTREQTLHLLALAGGWPGALAAQRLLRHKSRKASFRSVFWITVLANIGFVLWLASSRGAAFWSPFWEASEAPSSYGDRIKFASSMWHETGAFFGEVESDERRFSRTQPRQGFYLKVPINLLALNDDR